MELTDISYVKIDGVAEIVLARPAQRNPISASTRDQILWAVSDAEDDQLIGCILLRGEGTAFSAGGDLMHQPKRETTEDIRKFLNEVDDFLSRVSASTLPVVAAVHGYCLGAALALVASCDFVIAADDVRMGLPEGRIGLAGVSPLVPVIGPQWAKFLGLTGEMLSAERALQIGLALTVEPAAELLERSRELCRRLARLPREASSLNLATVDAIEGAAGQSERLSVGLVYNVHTLQASSRATAPDGRTFEEVIATEGMAGLKKARDAQFDTPWLR